MATIEATHRCPCCGELAEHQTTEKQTCAYWVQWVRAEAWKKAALILVDCFDNLENEPGYPCPNQEKYDKRWGESDDALEAARRLEANQ